MNRPGYIKQWRIANKAEIRAYDQARHSRLKNAVYAILGETCAVCGFSDRRALQIDHKKGGGSKDRKEMGYRALLEKVLKNPEDYQILCANHNWIKRCENGERP
jgi:hypothetical protein